MLLFCCIVWHEESLSLIVARSWDHHSLTAPLIAAVLTLRIRGRFLTWTNFSTVPAPAATVILSFVSILTTITTFFLLLRTVRKLGSARAARLSLTFWCFWFIKLDKLANFVIQVNHKRVWVFITCWGFYCRCRCYFSLRLLTLELGFLNCSSLLSKFSFLFIFCLLFLLLFQFGIGCLILRYLRV